jgi:DNA-binding XRE family transcriptional regulator
MAEINVRLKRARARRFWTIQQAAELIGVSFQTYIRWEHGTQVPHFSSLEMLCKTFGAKPEDLGFSELIGGNDDKS